MVLSFNAVAYKLQYASVITNYSGCVWKNNGDGTSTLQVTANFKSITGNLGVLPNGNPSPDSDFISRGILIYMYDANGKMRPSSNTANYVAINGSKSTSGFVGDEYVIYGLGSSDWDPFNWKNRNPFTAVIEVMINNAEIRDWPGISIRAGNYKIGDDVGEITGGAYVTNTGSANTCQVINPEVPPPPTPSLVVDVAAPDWNLEELPRGDGEKTLAGAAQQLCFTYRGLDGYRNFVINASSANGISGNRYLLRNASKPSQTVPYDLTLDSGSATFRLPNTSASPVRLNNGARTCFVPTFRTSVDATVDAGDYSDVLSFTVVTKS